MTNWTPEQTDIFAAGGTTSSHLIIKAYAGTGKTTTMAGLVPHLGQGSIAAMAFGRETRETLARRMPDVHTQTFHSLALASLKAAGFARGAKDVDKRKIYKHIRQALTQARVRDSLELGRDLKDVISFAKNTLLEPNESGMRRLRRVIVNTAMSKLDPDLLTSIAAAAFTTSLTEIGTLDYDDCMYMPWLYKVPMLGFRTLIVDEVQDINAAQKHIIGGVCRERLIAVGDELQRIYSFRGALPTVLASIQNELGAVVFPLSVTFRCGHKIVEYVKTRVDGLSGFQAPTGAHEGCVLEASVDQMIANARPGDFVISRTNAIAAQSAVQINRAGTPAICLGSTAFERAARLIDEADALNIVAGTWPRWASQYIEEQRVRGADVEEVIDVVKTASVFVAATPTLDAAKAKLTAIQGTGVAADAVICTTAHRIKGQEADRVWVRDETFRAEEGGDEANLLYVACTRAKNELFMVQDDKAQAAIGPGSSIAKA